MKLTGLSIHLYFNIDLLYVVSQPILSKMAVDILCNIFIDMFTPSLL